MRRFGTAIVLAGLAACAHGSNGVDDADADPIVIGLDTTACYGTCPAYSVVIRASGMVEYIGMSFVKKRGQARRKLTPNTMRDLVAAFDTAGFAGLPEDLEGNHNDVPHLYLSYRDRSVHYSDGERVRGTLAADTVLRLVDAVGRAVRIERWIGTPADRRGMTH